MNTEFNPSVLDKIRYEQGIRSDTALADALDVDRSTVTRWRNGESIPSFTTLSRMVWEYGISFKEMTQRPEVAAA